MKQANVGEIRMYGGAYTPQGWMPCDGRAVSRESYGDLFDVIGTRFGGDQSTFLLPDLSSTANVQAGVAFIIYHGEVQ